MPNAKLSLRQCEIGPKFFCREQELLDRIKELETEVERLKKLTPQELINEIESYKEEVAQLKIQLEKLNSQQSAQIEVKR